jgi:ADP-ribose pyrophosphatase YjhB (NUDIX family)
MNHVHLATGLARRADGAVLLVASRYANHEQPLWNLPGGRQRPGELLVDTVAREVLEETGYRVRVGELAYVSESYDSNDGVHFINATFLIEIESESAAPGTGSDDHIVNTSWVSIAELASRIAVAVVREPLLAYVTGTLNDRYAGFAEAGITIRWPDPPVR